MKKYLTISRKFRPHFFSDVIGQEPITTTLKNALRLGKVANAYLFTGTRGTGKTTLARIFAKALNCKNINKDTTEPCNSCSSCLEILSGSSLNVIEIDGASNRGIDDIRQINDTIGYAPADSGYKIYIIDEVHMLTKEAFNALLKTLEEPPEKVKFFLATTEPHKILPTIISRCQRFDCRRISNDLIMGKLTSIAQSLSRTIEENALRKITLFAEGSLRDAESLFEQVLCYEENLITEEIVDEALGFVPTSLLFELDKAFQEGNIPYVFTLTESIYHSGKDFGSFLDQLSEHYRNILACKKGLSISPKYAQSLEIYTEDQCLYILDLILEAMHRMQKSPLKRTQLEMLLVHLLQSKKRVSLEKVLERLMSLEKKLSAPQQPGAAPLPKAESISEPKIEKAPEPTTETPKVEEKEIPPPPPIEEIAAPSKLEEKVIEKALLPIAEQKIEKLAEPAATIVEEKKEIPPLKPVAFSIAPMKKEAPAPVQETPKVSSPPEPIASQPKVENPSLSKDPKITARYDTLMRFAAIELEGTLKKGGPHG